MNQNSDKKVIVALSGGVDSAVSAALLMEQGYNLEGVFMKNWSGDDYSIQDECPWETDQRDAEEVCKILGIPFRSVNFEKEYREKVVEYFFEEYKNGRTPNPDVMCNKEIKFKAFMEKAFSLGADLIATGHYASITKQGDSYLLKRGKDLNKDQSYFLHTLSSKQLSKVLFPIGELKKKKVRELARKYKLPVSEKKDSQGICFIGKIDVQEFLRKRLDTNTGQIIDIDKHDVVGKHDGLNFYTIGQRQGLGIGGVDIPYYVVAKEKQKNILYVAKGTNNKHLMKKEVNYSNLFLNKTPRSKQIGASIRYRHEPQLGEINIKSQKFNFDQPQRAISPGQSIVFYEGEICLGGAIIE